MGVHGASHLNLNFANIGFRYFVASPAVTKSPKQSISNNIKTEDYEKQRRNSQQLREDSDSLH